MALLQVESISVMFGGLAALTDASLAVEAGTTSPWYKYVGLDGAVIGIDVFGESAPAEYLFQKYGFTVDNVVERALKLHI